MSAQDNKKYYWLKLQDDFFKRHDIQIVENMPNGKDYIIFYLKLLCESTSHEGALRFSQEIPYNDEMLSTITNTNIDIVRSAIKILGQLKMIEILDDGTLYMHQVAKMLGSETGGARRLREYRKNTPKLPTGTNVPNCNLDIDIEIEKEIEKDIRHKYGEYKNVLLTDEQFEKLKTDYPFDWQERIEKVSLYCQSTGKKYKDYLATIRNWANKDKSKNQKKDIIPDFSHIKNPEFDEELFEKLGGNNRCQ